MDGFSIIGHRSCGRNCKCDIYFYRKSLLSSRASKPLFSSWMASHEIPADDWTGVCLALKSNLL